MTTDGHEHVHQFVNSLTCTHIKKVKPKYVQSQFILATQCSSFDLSL